MKMVKTDVPCKNLVDVGGCWRPPMQQKVPMTVTVTIPRWFSITSVPLKGTRLAKVNDKFEESRCKSTSSLQNSLDCRNRRDLLMTSELQIPFKAA